MRHVRLVLCRHTQTQHNLEGRISGAREHAVLNDTGLEQARILTAQLKFMCPRPVAIISSDLVRTAQVAAIISPSLGDLPVQADKRLREVDVGTIGGMLKKDAAAAFPEPHHRTFAPDYDFRDIGGESRDEVIERQIAAFRDTLVEHGWPTCSHPLSVIVVGHGTALRTMLGHLGTGLTLHAQGEYQVILVTDATLAL
jgi:broad specificity phosphatase PhoE